MNYIQQEKMQYVEGKDITGVYTLQEIYPTEGYILNETPVEFRAQKDATGNLKLEIISGKIRENVDEIQVDNTDPNNPVISITIDNDPIFTLTKVDAETGEPLEGVEFEITDLDGDKISDANGNVIDKVYTDSNGEIRLSLLEGLYKATETQPLEGYETSELYTGIGIGESKEGKTAVTTGWKNQKLGFVDFDDVTTVSDGVVAVGKVGQVVKFDLDGNTVWTNLDLEINYNKIITVTDGVIVVGYYGTISKYNFSGELVWTNQEKSDYNYYGVVEVADGYITVSEHGQIVKYSLDGEILWENVDYIYEDDEVLHIVLLDDGIISFTCYGKVIKSSLNGEFLWEKTPTNYYYKDMIGINDGFVAVGNDGVIVKYDFEGNVIWENTERTYNYYSVEVTLDAIIAVCDEGRLAKYDLNGNYLYRVHDEYSIGMNPTAVDGGIIFAEDYGPNE